MEYNKAPRPDEFPAEFYQWFWPVIKGDFMPMFAELYNENLALYKFNFGLVTLLHKKEYAIKIQQFCPVCLINVSFKIFKKVATNRATVIAHKVARPTPGGGCCLA